MIHLMTISHNNQKTIAPFLAAVQVGSAEWGQPFRAIVVDDGSSDATVDSVQDFASQGPFELIRHPEPLGEGRALQTGLEAVLERTQPDDVIITLDVNNMYSPAVVKTMLPLVPGKSDVVLASRFNGGREIGLPISLVLIHKGSSWLMRQLFRVPGIRDYSSRCRAHRAEVVQALAFRYPQGMIQESGPACWVEILLKLAQVEDIVFAQVPLVIRYDLEPSQELAGPRQVLRNNLDLLNRGRRYR